MRELCVSLWTCFVCKPVEHCAYVAGADISITTTTRSCQDQLYGDNALLWTKLEHQLGPVCWCWWSDNRPAACRWWHYQCLPWCRPTRMLVQLMYIMSSFHSLSMYCVLWMLLKCIPFHIFHLHFHTQICNTKCFTGTQHSYHGYVISLSSCSYVYIEIWNAAFQFLLEFILHTVSAYCFDVLMNSFTLLWTQLDSLYLSLT